MRRAALIVVCALAVLLQVSFLPALRPLGVVPNIMLPLVVLLGLEGTVSLAAVAAVAGGLAVDLASGANFGLWTGTLILAAVVAGLVNRAGFDLIGPAAAAIVAGGTLLMDFVILTGLVSTAVTWPWGVIIGHVVLELMLNLALAFALRPVVRALAGGGQAEMVVR